MFVSRQIENLVKNLTYLAKRHSYLIFNRCHWLVVVSSIYSVIIIINTETATKIDFSQFYRNEF